MLACEGNKDQLCKTMGKYFERHNKRSLPAQNPGRILKSCFNFDVHVKSKAVAVTSRPSKKTAITLAVAGAIVSGK